MAGRMINVPVGNLVAWYQIVESWIFLASDQDCAPEVEVDKFIIHVRGPVLLGWLFCGLPVTAAEMGLGGAARDQGSRTWCLQP